MNVEEWFHTHRYKSKSFKSIKRLVQLKKEKKQTISLVIPTFNEAANIGNTISAIKPKLMDKYGLLDEIIVVDSGSTDSTKQIVKNMGVDFYYSKDILKKYRNYKGKGENIWKSLYITKGDIIVFIDADIKNIHPRFVYCLVGPLLTNERIKYTKSFFRRPIKEGEGIIPSGGGRITELLARPLINLYYPRLSGFIQPLSGQFAGRRATLEKIPVFTGYGVDLGMLVDITRKFGLKSIAQVNLVKLVQRHRPLADLSDTAFDLLRVFAKRANTFGKLILVDKLRDKYRVIERYKENGRVQYKLKSKTIARKERPPIITIQEYRRKFKKEAYWLAIK